jgi:hypothetical protein
MLNRLSKCETCGSPLVDGADAERHGGNNHLKCIVKGIPTKVCSRGCAGAYWYWLDFGVEVLEALGPDSPNIAKRRIGLFKTRHLCRRCDAELTDKQQSAQFVFHQKLRKGTELELTVEAPCLECIRCGAKYLPSQTSSHDPYYSEMADVVGATITNELIWK